MKNQALFSSKDKNKKNENVVCCNFCLALKGLMLFNLLRLQIVHWVKNNTRKCQIKVVRQNILHFTLLNKT